MKTAATGNLCQFDKCENEGNTKNDVRLHVVMSGKKSKEPVRVIHEMDDWEIIYWRSELKRIAEARAAAHDSMAARLREAI